MSKVCTCMKFASMKQDFVTYMSEIGKPDSSGIMIIDCNLELAVKVKPNPTTRTASSKLIRSPLAYQSWQKRSPSRGRLEVEIRQLQVPYCVTL